MLFQNYTKDQLTPHARRLFARILDELPASISVRLRASRCFVTHGNRRNHYSFQIWDRFQNGVLPKAYFKYSIVYDRDRLKDGGFDGLFHLWLTTVRIYRNRDDVRAYLEREIKRVAPPNMDFEFVEGRAIECGRKFIWPKNLAAIEDVLLEPLVDLISAVHPVLIPVIDQYAGRQFTSRDRGAEVASRGRIKVEHKGPLDRALVRQYTRSIPPSWRQKIIEAAAFTCAHCGADLRVTGHEIDHIVPFSKGGATVMENLQALCPKCNATKGNRYCR